MKKRLFVLLGLGLLLVSVTAYAQSARVKAAVPFDFIVGNATLPAGEYTIEPLGAALSIRDADQKPKSLIMSNRCESLDPSDTTKLVFHRYGNRYFLAQIWVAGEMAGRQVAKSPRETEVALDYPVQNVVVVAALR